MGITKGLAFPSTYVSKEDLSQPRTFTIRDVVIAEIEGDGTSKNRPVMSFAEDGAKDFILNSGNFDTCEDAFGANTDSWLGKKIELYVDPGVMYAGKRVGGIRCRVPSGAATPPPVSAPPPALGCDKNQAWAAWAPLPNGRDGFLAVCKSLNKPEGSFTSEDWEGVKNAAKAPF